MYIREDVDKLRHRRWIASIWAAVLLIVMVACLIRTESVSKQQGDTLNQIIELRRDVDAMAVSAPDPVAPILPAMELSAEDYDLICAVVAAEARGEGYEGQLAVAQVIRDRAVLWGMSPAAVVSASGQFAAPYQGEIGPDVMAAVNDCLVLGYSAFDEAVTHFHEASITPYWVEDKQLVGVISNHKFYR